MNIQPVLENIRLKLVPLTESDFEAVFIVASDPKVWEQHPNKDRWKREVFRTFFDGALASKGSFKIIDKATEEVLGCSRYYDFNEDENSIFVGYTFYGTSSWGKGVDPEVKKLMLDHIFQDVDVVKFHVGKDNRRSKIAMERLGAKPIKEIEVAYYGENPKINIEFWITKKDWQK